MSASPIQPTLKQDNSGGIVHILIKIITIEGRKLTIIPGDEAATQILADRNLPIMCHVNYPHGFPPADIVPGHYRAALKYTPCTIDGAPRFRARLLDLRRLKK